MSDLRKHAKEARKRLRTGFWAIANAERRAVIENARENGQDVKVVEDMCRRKIQNKIRQMEYPNRSNSDEDLYKKVCEIMESETFVMNPLSQLIDHQVYDDLDEHGKQVYILKLSEQYVEMKKRYKSEHELNLGMAF